MGYANLKSLLSIEDLQTFIENNVVTQNLFIITSGLLSTPVCKIASEIEEINVKVMVFTGNGKRSEPLLEEYPKLMHRIVTTYAQLVKALHEIVS